MKHKLYPWLIVLFPCLIIGAVTLKYYWDEATTPDVIWSECPIQHQPLDIDDISMEMIAPVPTHCSDTAAYIQITNNSDYYIQANMRQIIANYLVIFIIPLLVGALIRFLLRKRNKAWLVTVLSAFLALAAFIAERTIPVHGSERNALLLFMAVCLLIGSLLMGIITRIMCHRK